MGAGGRDPFNLPRDVGTRVPLPSSSPDLRELDPGEQCTRRGGVKGGRWEDNISGKRASFPPLIITDSHRFISPAL